PPGRADGEHPSTGERCPTAGKRSRAPKDESLTRERDKGRLHPEPRDPRLPGGELREVEQREPRLHLRRPEMEEERAAASERSLPRGKQGEAERQRRRS